MKKITWDTVNKGKDVVLSNGDLTAVISNSINSVRASEGKTTSKWYWEVIVGASDISGGTTIMIGIVNNLASMTDSKNTVNVRYYYGSNGFKWSDAGVAYGT
ncbi:hypothetical protein ACFVRU_55185, partial [Streptomyces sp. NPDC057927]